MATEHWQNTLLHWAHSLRARGFLQSEVISEVGKWKDDNGPVFHSRSRRYPPALSEIAEAYNTRHCRGTLTPDYTTDVMDKMEDCWRPDDSRDGRRNNPNPFPPIENRKKKLPEDFNKPPPSSYICNRCSKKGLSPFHSV